MTLEMVTAPCPNEPGQLARVTMALAVAGVEIRGFSCDVDHIHIVTRQGELAEIIMSGLFGDVKRGPVIDLPIEARGGIIVQLCRRLAEADININVAYGMAIGGQARIILQVSDADRAAAVVSAVLPDKVIMTERLGRI